MTGQFKYIFIIIALLCFVCSMVSAAAVTQSITYQGMLTNAAGIPLTGSYSVTFKLYNVSSGGSTLATDTHSVQAAKGLFTTQITADPKYFDGRALWLGIKVGADAEMTPRQELRPVPYAMSLRPGATIDGSGLVNTRILTTIASGDYSAGFSAMTSGYHSNAFAATTYNDASNGVYVTTTGTGSEGIRSYTNGTNSAGLFAHTYGLNSPGVYGESISGPGVSGKSPDNTGVMGYSGTGVGVWGEAPAWVGVYGNGSLYGVEGMSQNVGVYGGRHGKIGVLGESTDGVGVWGSSTTKTGVYGLSTSDDGVHGYSQYGTGVSGESQTGTGVYGIGKEGGYFTTNSAGTSWSDLRPGVNVSTVFDYNPGVRINTNGLNSHGVDVSTTNQSSFGVRAAVTGANSLGVQGYSVQDIGVGGYSDNYIGVGGYTSRSDQKYGIYTPDYLYAKGTQVPAADVAEYMQVTEDVAPGTVLVIGEDGKLQPSTTAYDTRVAGIVSTEPGVSLGTKEGGNPGEETIAVAGRVTCKVDATSAPIHAGDLLTTSDNPGYAMKAVPLTFPTPQ